MDWQHFINLGSGVALTVMGWFARQLWDAVKALQNDLKRLELSISDNYVKKTEMQTLKADMDKRFDRIEMLIDKIAAKLDAKADK
jgi:hypothetical protein